jgi:diguanylate cyclase (GGDEF)-like protein
MERDATAEVKRLKQEFLEMERVNRDERDSLVKVIQVLGTVMTAQPDLAEGWESLRQQINPDGPLSLDGIEDGLKKVKDKILSKEWGSESLLRQVDALKGRLLESHKAVRKILFSLMDDFYPLTADLAARAVTVKAELTDESVAPDAVAGNFQDFLLSLRTKIQEDFRYVNSGFITLLNQVKELEKLLAKDLAVEEGARKVEYFEMKLSEEVGHIMSSFNLYTTIAEIKNAVIEKIENIKRMVRARKQEELDRLRASQRSILTLKKRIAEAEKEALELTKRAEQFQTAAMKDGLTALYNRKAFDLRLSNALAGISAASSPFVLILFDVNDFKSINDSFGHVAGDKVLQKVAQILTESFRKGDFIARFGGDEFAAVIEEMDEEMARERVSAFRKNLEKRRFTSYKKGDIRVCVSAGISVAKDKDTPESVLDRADKAMYKDKNNE